MDALRQNFYARCQRVIKIQFALLSLYSVLVGSVLLFMCVRGGLQSKLYTSQQWRRQEGGQGERSPINRKIFKDGKQPAP